MFKNYFKITWRNLVKNKTFSVINIGGLAIGIASSLLLLSYVSFQFGYDNFHAKGQNIYRVNLDLYQNNKLVFQSAENYSALGPALKRDYPEVIDVARLYNMGYKNNCVFTYNDFHFRETKFLYADASFLTMFSFPFSQGDPRSALSQPYTAVISESTSDKIFGNRNAIGKFIKMDDDDRNSELCKITGVFKDVPENSHIKFNILISYTTLYHRGDGIKRFENTWDRKDFYTYILLRPGADPKLLQAKFPSFISRHIPEEKANYKESKLVLQSLEKIHLTSNLIDEPEPTRSEKAIAFLVVIGIFIITIAWVNYINLSTAGSLNRAKEVGIRKVLGSQRIQLIKQFLTESLSINMVSFGIAIILIYSLHPLLHQFFQVDFSLSGLFTNSFGLIFIALMLAGSFLSGLYPAFVLSSFKPISVLKGKIKASGNGVALRKSLVVFQFSLSIFLIIGTFIVYQQLHYMLNQNLGIKVSQVLVMDRPGRWDTARRMHNLYVQRFKEALTKNPAIEAVGMSDELPGKEIRGPGYYTIKNASDRSAIPVNTIGIDENFLQVLGINIFAGRNFSLKYKTDENAIIVTGSAARLLGFKRPEDAIGKEVLSGNTTYSIIGVVNDFHQLSLQKKVEPAIFQFNGSDAREFEYYLVRIKTANIHQAIDQVQNAWNNAFKENPFSFSFLDEYFNRQYKSEIQFGILFGVFSIIAILIACIGLFALVAFMIEQRTKEIGVRKVLGAGVRDIITLLTKDFVRLVLIANLIAWPLGWSLMNSWLKDFAYRINISWWIFIAAGTLALLIALITVSFQAIKAAIANPVRSLRTE
jgi:putative ABC transport system permease protein